MFLIGPTSSTSSPSTLILRAGSSTINQSIDEFLFSFIPNINQLINQSINHTPIDEFMLSINQSSINKSYIPQIFDSFNHLYKQ